MTRRDRIRSPEPTRLVIDGSNLLYALARRNERSEPPDDGPPLPAVGPRWTDPRGRSRRVRIVLVFDGPPDRGLGTGASRRARPPSQWRVIADRLIERLVPTPRPTTPDAATPSSPRPGGHRGSSSAAGPPTRCGHARGGLAGATTRSRRPERAIRRTPDRRTRSLRSGPPGADILARRPHHGGDDGDRIGADGNPAEVPPEDGQSATWSTALPRWSPR